MIYYGDATNIDEGEVWGSKVVKQKSKMDQTLMTFCWSSWKIPIRHFHCKTIHITEVRYCLPFIHWWQLG